MSYLIPNSFSSYSLTDKELKEGSKLTITQVEVLQNRMSMIAEQKLQLKLDPEHPQHFIQQEAYMQGQLDILDAILDDSKTFQLTG